MIKTDLTECLMQMFPGEKISEGNQYVEMTVDPDKLYEVSKILFQAAELSFDYMICMTGVDYPEKIQIVYHLESTKLRHVMVLKTNTLDRENPVLDSLSGIWHTAKYHEREVYDLLGVKFNNHIDMRRLFLDDSWGFPLRKDYVDELRIIKR
jgi:NADH-quinone oxidoreductase subunit C